jgi:biotin transport system substrate-specific component
MPRNRLQEKQMSKSAAQFIANIFPLSLQSAATVIGGVALLTLSAKIQIPFWPVPLNLQSMAVMALAIGLGPRLAVTAFAAYLATGASGLPVFAGSPERGLGLAYLAGPTGGYLIGMLAASWLTGTLGGGRDLLVRSGAMLAGMAVIYGLGVAWLALYVPAPRLLTEGIAPFILGDLLKIGIVAAGASLVSGRGRLAE